MFNFEKLEQKTNKEFAALIREHAANQDVIREVMSLDIHTDEDRIILVETTTDWGGRMSAGW